MEGRLRKGVEDLQERITNWELKSKGVVLGFGVKGGELLGQGQSHMGKSLVMVDDPKVLDAHLRLR